MIMILRYITQSLKLKKKNEFYPGTSVAEPEPVERQLIAGAGAKVFGPAPEPGV
jgi:hypothetical protein